MGTDSEELVQAEESRKMEIKKLTGEEYQKQYDLLTDGLKRDTRSFQNVNYVESQMAGLSSQALESLLQYINSGKMEDAKVVAKDYLHMKETFSLQKGRDGDAVRAMMQHANSFLHEFGLEKFVSLKPGMSGDQIQQAIDTGYQAKMWGLTNRME